MRGRSAGDPLTAIRNAALQDDRLSYRARGILAAVLSHPPGRITSANRIAELGKEGREAVEVALQELARHGYLRRRRRQLADGRFRTDWDLTDDPRIYKAAGHTENGLPVIGKPSLGRPGLKTKRSRSKEEVTPPPTSSTNPKQDKGIDEQTADTIRAALPAGAHRRSVVTECRRLLAAGWTPEGLLAAAVAHDWTGAGGGAGIAWLRDLGAPPRPRARPPAKPPWCGSCDEVTRTVEGPRRGAYASVIACPTCHPKTARRHQ